MTLDDFINFLPKKKRCKEKGCSLYVFKESEYCIRHRKEPPVETKVKFEGKTYLKGKFFIVDTSKVMGRLVLGTHTQPQIIKICLNKAQALDLERKLNSL